MGCGLLLSGADVRLQRAWPHPLCGQNNTFGGPPQLIKTCSLYSWAYCYSCVSPGVAESVCDQSHRLKFGPFTDTCKSYLTEPSPVNLPRHIEQPYFPSREQSSKQWVCSCQPTKWFATLKKCCNLLKSLQPDPPSKIWESPGIHQACLNLSLHRSYRVRYQTGP